MALRTIGNVSHIRGGLTALWALMPELTGDASDDQLPLFPGQVTTEDGAVPTCQTPRPLPARQAHLP